MVTVIVFQEVNKKMNMVKGAGDKGYKDSECRLLLNLMLKNNFELCYKIDHAPQITYIAPQLLPGVKPAYDWDSLDNLYFRYQYQFMPKGIISRLIVRLNVWIDCENKKDLVWEKGVVLHKDGIRAQIIEEITKTDGLKVINITLSGAEFRKKEFLIEIRKEIDSIHRTSFKNINAKAMVPIPENPDIAVSYDHLLVLQSKRIAAYIPEGMTEEVWVQHLLDGVEIRNRDDEIRRRTDENFVFQPTINFKPEIHTSSTAAATSRSESSS